MAKARRKRKRKRKINLKPGDCRVITIKGRGKRNFCNINGVYRFKKMSYKPRKRRKRR